MDKLIFDNASQGMEGSWENLATLQRGILNGLEAAIKSLINNYDSSDIYVLSGCEITVNSQDFEITEGYVFHNDEVFKVSASSFTAPGGQIGVFNLGLTSINTTFENGSDYEVEQTRVIVFEAGASGSGIKNHDETIDLSASLFNKLDISNFVSSAVSGKVNKSGDSMTGNLAMGSNKVTGLANGSSSGDAVNKGQMDSGDSARVAKSGDSMTGNLAMGSNKVTGLANGSSSSDAVNKGQLDTVDNKTPLLTKVVNIGDWNMDTTATLSVSHGLTLSKIRRVTAIIRADNDANYFQIDSGNAAGDIQGAVFSISTTTVQLSRTTGGQFDHTDFNSTSFNRGWIVIDYTP
ncbi:hypothetical protein [Reichenbachiella sp.]|uniref:hypothetical protein n=1 Tax=Reichenbachiella sp. TaxID=2184521 RepID=UPI003B5A836D